MYNQIERELKQLLQKEQYEKLRKSYDFPVCIHQTNTYYDTDDQLLKNMSGALRLRTIDNKTIFTLKIRQDAITLTELEKEITGNTLDDAFKDLQIQKWLKQYKIPTKVHPIANFSTVRYLKKLEKGELCLDQTNFGSKIDYECEYEYTCNHDGIQIFNEILKPIGIKYKKNGPSKLARAIKFSNNK